MWLLTLRARFDPLAALRIGDQLADGYRAEKAMKYYRRAAGSSHPHAGSFGALGLGRMLGRLGDRAGAEEALQAAIDSGHTDVTPAAQIALAEELVYRNQPDIGRALDLMEQAIESGHPEHAPEALLWLAKHWDLEGEVSAAVDAYERAAIYTQFERSSRALWNSVTCMSDAAIWKPPQPSTAQPPSEVQTLGKPAGPLTSFAK